MNPTIAPLRRSANRLRGAVHAPAAEAALPELMMLVRFLGIGVLLAGALSVYLWASTGVRETSLQIDRTRHQLEAARVAQERLTLERAMLRDPGRLVADASSLGLVAPVATVDLTGGAKLP